MPEWIWIVIAVVVVVIVGLVVWTVSRRRRTSRLKQQFGPEYDRTVGERGEQRAGEAELLARQKKHDELEITALTPQARREHAAAWQKVQAEFVDDPEESVGRAERLVTRVMRDRGYPIDEFDQRAADISVDHPEVVDNYRSAHEIYASRKHGEIGTERARQAFVHYRALFDKLLGSEADVSAQDQHAQEERQTHDHA